MHAHTAEYPEHEGYDLFERAIVERDGHAWAVIYTRYRRLLLAWAQRFSRRLALNERADDLADQAFARAWAALTPEHFSRFPTLASLLAYLRSCVSSTVIDIARTRSAREQSLDTLEMSCEATPEQIVVGELERGEIWQIAGAATRSMQEQAVLVESFVYDQPPRSIHARHPELFPDVGSVYRAKRNLLERLQHNQSLQGLHLL
ncbi:MAG: hypothetical protein U0Z44_00995 [Kouleothrix sp.]|jgi:DNA-directed RNA polymerase specialized sigma24 family protein|nr:sigma-70 family RNA polymerase sigma factor [Kouleothrix sp.]